MMRLAAWLVPTFAVLASGCVAGPRAAAAPATQATTWTPQTPFPQPEGDLAYVRGYAAAGGWSYTPEQERLALLNMFHFRAERERLPGYVQAWSDIGIAHVNVKPPYDRSALLALASPELRGELIVHEVRHDKTEVAALQQRLVAALEALGKAEFTLSHDYRKDRFDLTIVGQEQAAKLRASLPSDLLAITEITLGESPLVVF